MSTIANRKYLKLVYGLLVLFLVTKCIECLKKGSKNEPSISPTKKSYNISDGDQYIDQSKVPPPAPNNDDHCVLGSADMYLSWWIHENGTLSLPDYIGTFSHNQ